jgi:pilus assembly protein Flp/PilA
MGAGLIINSLRKLMKSTKGATAIEYGLIVTLIAVAAMAAMFSLADTTIGMWDNIADNVLAS